MPKSFLIAWIVVLPLFGIGCSLSDGTARAPGIHLRLLDPGAEPRRQLRYAFQTVRVETMVSETQATSEMVLGASQERQEMHMPTKRRTTRIEERLLTDGNLRCEFEIVRAEVIPDPRASEMDMQGEELVMQLFRGLKGHSIVTPRGFVTELDIPLLSFATSVERLIIDTWQEECRQEYVPFPDEAVGKGAKWEVTLPPRVAGLSVHSTVVYTIEDVRGDLMDVAIAMTGTLPEQDQRPSWAPPLKIQSMSTRGSGRCTLDLTHLVPTVEIKQLFTEMKGQALDDGPGALLAAGTKVSTKMKVEGKTFRQEQKSGEAPGAGQAERSEP